MADLRGILLLEDEPCVRNSVLRWIPDADVATTWEEGGARVKAFRYRGMIADIGLDGCTPRPGDRTGIDHAERAHARAGTRIMILSAFFAPEWKARGDRIHAQYTLKPYAPWVLLAFRDHCFGASAEQLGDDVRAAMDASVAKLGWTAAEASIVLLCTQGHDERAIAGFRRVSVNTLRNQIATLLNKSGDDHLWQAALRVVHEARRIGALQKRK